MPTSAGKLSAIARRRLRDAQTETSNTPSPSATPIHVTEERPPLPVQDANSSHENCDALQDQNQFTPLVESSAVQFSDTREIEQLNEISVKVKLSRGQKCIVLGIYELWVKHGMVSVYGAILEASTATHRIFAPETYALPPIEAVSKTAEIQIESVEDGIRNLPFVGTRNPWCPAGSERTRCSFYILGHTFRLDQKAPNRYKTLDITPWKQTFADLCGTALSTTTENQRRLLVLGKRSTGKSTFVRCIVNRMFSQAASSKTLVGKYGINFIDLDADMPEFTPPGLASLIECRDFMFGPPIANLTRGLDRQTRIQKSHFAGEVDAFDISPWQVDQIFDLLAEEKQLNEQRQESRTRIIIAPRWLHKLDQQSMKKLWTQLTPTDIICFDPNPDSAFLTPFVTLIESSKCAVHQISSPTYDKLASHREHDLQMQSYFHLAGGNGSGNFWSEIPTWMDGARRVSLSYKGENADVIYAVLLGGSVSLEDTYEALVGGLVAIVCLQHERGGREPAPRNGAATDYTAAGRSMDWNATLPLVSLTDEGLPRYVDGAQPALPFPAERSFCAGFGIVSHVNVLKGQVHLITGLDSQAYATSEERWKYVLVAMKASADGKYSTNWVRRELDDYGIANVDRTILGGFGG